ncbi:hypothetical protein GUJ93_ZPchr0008g12730 [Zizania palustris]|uniref:BHLH domain-containing protein n=1 Tax=Zizania palustris TaxID=103762 RepID=A0A8J5V3D8_ZIZPA|nr:hypothetical protein GUJ93_ZPchr0008g12730 [Zizania palustris]
MDEVWCSLDMATAGIQQQPVPDLHDPSFWTAFADCATSFIAGGDNACFGDIMGTDGKVEGMMVAMDDDSSGFLMLDQQQPMLSSTTRSRSIDSDSGGSMSSFSLDAASAGAPPNIVVPQYPAAPTSVTHGLFSGGGGNNDDVAIMRAMMAIISSPSASPSSSGSACASASSAMPFGRDSVQQPAGPAMSPPQHQEEARAVAVASGNSSQLYHMMSERKRREKLNDSFHTLRLLLPPCSKKDRTTVLVNAAKYVKTLETDISELEEKNGKLEKHIDGGRSDSDAMRARRAQQRAKVQISKQAAAAASQHEEQQQQLVNLTVTVMVMVECDVVELVLHILECLKWMKEVNVLSVDADTYSPQVLLKAIASIKLQIMGGDWNEASFHEAMTKAANDATFSCAPLALTA